MRQNTHTPSCGHATANVGRHTDDAKFPGGPGGNLPQRPHVVVAPVGLLEQWTSEFKRFADHGAFSFVPYIGTFTAESRAAFWDSWEKLDHAPHRRVLLVSASVRIFMLITVSSFC